jgi:2-oxo-3-hexenedioate decarboxylase
MNETRPAANLDAIAAEAVSVLGTARQVAPFSSRYSGFELKDAYRVTAKVRALREKSGESARGRKIGFTNRTIWAQFGMDAPMWGYLYDRTIHDLANIDGTFSLTGLAEPRIEPEIVFGLGAAPRPGMDATQLLACIDWVAQGFEVVQSIFPEWRFAPPDTVAAFGMHGALLIGPRHPLRGAEQVWASALSTFEIDLRCGGDLVDHGAARNVLDGPLFALAHLIDVLAKDPASPPLAAGEIVTTGTLTQAPRVHPGEVWSTRLTGIALDGVSVKLT